MKKVVIKDVPCRWVSICPECGDVILDIPTKGGLTFKVLMTEKNLKRINKVACQVTLTKELYPVMYKPNEIYLTKPKDIKKVAKKAADTFWEKWIEDGLKDLFSIEIEE